jgi:5-methyltetrahydrofolate--homocysteine methyltransferase
MTAVVEALVKAGKRDRVSIVVGGAPVTADYAQTIGADGYASDASQAVHMIEALIRRDS